MYYRVYVISSHGIIDSNHAVNASLTRDETNKKSKREKNAK